MVTNNWPRVTHPCVKNKHIHRGNRLQDQLPTKPPQGNWVQTERSAHEAWAALIAKAPKAAQLMHVLTARVGENNAVVVSQQNLVKLTGTSRRTVQRALDVLIEDRWIETRQIGQNGTVNAYVINDRVAWSGKRNGIRYSLFSATIIASDDEQPDRETLGQQEPLRKLPSLRHHQNPPSPAWNQTCQQQTWMAMMRNTPERSAPLQMEQGGTV